MRLPKRQRRSQILQTPVVMKVFLPTPSRLSVIPAVLPICRASPLPNQRMTLSGRTRGNPRQILPRHPAAKAAVDVPCCLTPAVQFQAHCCLACCCFWPLLDAFVVDASLTHNQHRDGHRRELSCGQYRAAIDFFR